MTDPTEIARVAAGLTRAQRLTMTGKLHQKPGGLIVPADLAVRKALARRGLVETAYGFITPAGLRVHDYILREKSGG